MVCWVVVAEAEARAARHDWELVAVTVEPGAEAAAERALEGVSFLVFQSALVRLA